MSVGCHVGCCLLSMPSYKLGLMDPEIFKGARPEAIFGTGRSSKQQKVVSFEEDHVNVLRIPVLPHLLSTAASCSSYSGSESGSIIPFSNHPA